MVRVVVFSGGRGSRALIERLAPDSGVHLTVAVNGYDDGASTGRVRRFLGDSLGPSDFRKNGSTLAHLLGACPPALISLLDYRLPVGVTAGAAEQALAVCRNPEAVPDDDTARSIASLAKELPEGPRDRVAERLDRFVEEVHATGRPFDYTDCAVGNLVFAGAFLRRSRRFNAAIADYLVLLGLRSDIVINVTDGANAVLAALTDDGTLLSNEASLVDIRQHHRVREVYLLRQGLSEDDQRELAALPADARAAALAARERPLTINPELVAAVARADLLVYAPGTQHSSLFPSYLTTGLGRAIAANLRATKVLVTNIGPDAEIEGRDAADIIERALFYLREKARLALPAPALITHYVINDPRPQSDARVQTGTLQAFADPRPVRIGDYEDGVTGRHSGDKVLAPFLTEFLRRSHRARVAVLLHDVDSENKLCQTLVEFIRGGLTDLPTDLLVVHGGPAALDRAFLMQLPFPVRHVPPGDDWDRAVVELLDTWGVETLVLFDSSGMYRGEDVAAVVAPIVQGRSEAVWGSRRLTRREIDASYRFRYRHNPVRGAISFVGSYALTLVYSVLFLRHVTDTLSGVRAMPYRAFRRAAPRLVDARTNHLLLANIFRSRVIFHEAPVRFLPLSPARVKRATIRDGLTAILTIIRCRFRGSRPTPDAGPGV